MQTTENFPLSTSQIRFQIEKLYEKIKFLTDQNQTGGTLDFDSNLISFDFGFLVSRKAPTFIYSCDEIPKDILIHALTKLYTKATKFDFIGFWIDGDKFYLDLSYHIKNKSQAILEGLNNEQVAIWDCKNKKSIYLNKYQF